LFLVRQYATFFQWNLYVTHQHEEVANQLFNSTVCSIR
jgi:hypothetical protein